MATMTEPSSAPSPWGLIVVDMQRYYLDRSAPFAQFHEHCDPGCLNYILKRCQHTVTENIRRLCDAAHERKRPVFYLRLCGKAPDRSDLHPIFRQANARAETVGFADIYPLESDPYSDIIPELSPAPTDFTFCKTTFSGFTTSTLADTLHSHGLKRLIITGLATSQCVETTARDAADRGYEIVHVEDAQADYTETTHNASLFSSQGVCGGHILTTDQILQARWFL